MFDNFHDYKIAELKKMISNYKQYHDIKITKKKKKELVDLLNEKFVLRNNVLYMKLDEGDRYLDKTERYLRNQNPEQHIPERKKQPAKPKGRPKGRPKKYTWDSNIQREKQRIRNNQQSEDNLTDEEVEAPPKKFKRLRQNNMR
jgi:hypothetical protein